MCVHFAILGFSKIIGVSLIYFKPSLSPPPLTLVCTVNIILRLLGLITFAYVIGRKKKLNCRNNDRRSEQMSRTVFSHPQSSVRHLEVSLTGVSTKSPVTAPMTQKLSKWLSY